MNTVHSTVYRLLNRKGIKLKPVSYLKDKHKDSTCFVDFEREDNSYFYGLLLADGNLSSLESRLSKIQITLKSSDKDILLQFKNFIGTNNKLVSTFQNTDKGIREYVHIGVNSYTIYNRLISLGMSPKKSMQEKLPNFDWKNNRHFWRGVVDGDGSLFYVHGKPKIKLIGSFELLEGFNEFCWKHCFTQKRKLYAESKHEGLYTISFNGEEALYVAKVLYFGCDLYLDRKHKLAMEFIDFYKNHRSGLKKGVSFSKRYNNYVVTLKIKGIRHSLGVFKDYREALNARINAEVNYYGKCFGEGKWHSILFHQLD